MSAFSGVQGLENLSSAKQQSRAGSFADNGFAYRPSAPHSHLSIAVSLPPQSNAGFRGGLYDIGAEYKHAVHNSPLGSNGIGDALMGSRLYMIRLGTLQKVVDGMSSEKAARYTVAANVDGGSTKLTLQPLSDENNNITINVSDATDDYSLRFSGQTIEVKSSFPVPDSVSSAGSSQHPFYRFDLGKGSKALEWQIEPLETGPLRYTLVQIDSVDTDEAPPKPEDIRAIYHHSGQAPSLSLSNCEGVLLLPEDGGSTEAMIVASLLGLLWRVRDLQVKPPVVNSTKLEKKSILSRLF